MLWKIGWNCRWQHWSLERNELWQHLAQGLWMPAVLCCNFSVFVSPALNWKLRLLAFWWCCCRGSNRLSRTHFPMSLLLFCKHWPMYCNRKNRKNRVPTFDDFSRYIAVCVSEGAPGSGQTDSDGNGMLNQPVWPFFHAVCGQNVALKALRCSCWKALRCCWIRELLQNFWKTTYQQ